MKKILILCFCIVNSIILAQQKQPKIGLVLSGGGAKGFAHVGVLKEIDKAGLQIDYIGGTSMGAIVGGLYAAGYSAIQIEEIVKNTDFVPLLRDKLPRTTTPFFEKEHGEKTKLTLPVSKGKIGLPQGVSRGQNVLSYFYELLGDSANIEDFSKLPIPFFCIATDVENGGQILLEKGSLPIALRASGSFPTLLHPVDVDGKLLVDGGIANNFPVSIMKSKGVDIIIGVDVEGRLFEKEKLTSVVAILNQIISYQMYHKSDQEKEKLDVYIHPDIFEFNVVDFDKKLGILKKGEEKGKEYTKVFQELAKKQFNKKGNTSKVINQQKRKISKINIKGSEDYTRAYVLGKLNLVEGDSLSNRDISKRIEFLSATRNYERIDYKFTSNNDDSYTLEFDLKESKDYASLSVGAHYDLLYKSSVLANYKQKHLLIKNDLLSLDLILGDNLRYNLNYFVDNGFYFSYGINSRYNHFRDNARFSSVDQPNISNINLSYTDFTNQLFVQTTFNRKFALGLGVEHKFLKATTPTILVNNEETVLDRSAYYSAFGYIKLDTYDKKYFATKGFYADLNFKWYISSTDFNNDFRKFAQTQGTLGFATTIADKFTFQMTNEAGFTLNNPSSEVFDFYLGGYNQNYINTFVSLYGYDFAELSEQSFIKSTFNFRYEVADKHYASFIANYARLEDNVFRDIDLFDDVKSGYAIGYSYDSFLGPLEIKYSWSPDTKQSHWLFNLGYWF